MQYRACLFRRLGQCSMLTTLVRSEHLFCKKEKRLALKGGWTVQAVADIAASSPSSIQRSRREPTVAAASSADTRDTSVSHTAAND